MIFYISRLQTEPPPIQAVLDNFNYSPSNIEGPSPIASPKSPPNFFDGSEVVPLAHSTLQVPKSPRTPRSMGHLIKHRFTRTYKPGKCDYCSDYMLNGKIRSTKIFDREQRREVLRVTML